MNRKNYLVITFMIIGWLNAYGKTSQSQSITAQDTTIEYPSGIKNSTDNALLIRELDNKSKDLEEKNKELTHIKKQTEAAHLDDLMHHKERHVFITSLAILLSLVLLIYFLYNKRARMHDKTLSSISQYQSHELRSPLVKIMGLVEVIKKSEEIKDQETIKQLKMLEDSAEELDTVIHKIVNKSVGTGE